MRPQERSKKDVEKHVHTEINGIAERDVNASREPRVTSEIEREPRENLRQTHQTKKDRYGEGPDPEPLPQFLRVHDAGNDHEIHQEVRKRHPALQPFVITPETLERHSAMGIGNPNNEYEER